MDSVRDLHLHNSKNAPENADFFRYWEVETLETSGSGTGILDRHP